MPLLDGGERLAGTAGHGRRRWAGDLCRPRRARSWRVWDNKARRWWCEQYEVQPDDLVAELNGAGDYTRVTALLRRYRTATR
jgi:hypothetical protein